MRKKFNDPGRVRTTSVLLAGALGAYFLVGVGSVTASALDVGNISVLSSENISTSINKGVLDVYLNTFRPNDSVDFEIHFNNSTPITILNGQTKQAVPANTGLQFSLTSGATLSESALFKPIKVIANSSGSPVVEIFPSPADFPVIA